MFEEIKLTYLTLHDIYKPYENLKKGKFFNHYFFYSLINLAKANESNFLEYACP